MEDESDTSNYAMEDYGTDAVHHPLQITSLLVALLMIPFSFYVQSFEQRQVKVGGDWTGRYFEIDGTSGSLQLTLQEGSGKTRNGRLSIGLPDHETITLDVQMIIEGDGTFRVSGTFSLKEKQHQILLIGHLEEQTGRVTKLQGTLQTQAPEQSPLPRDGTWMLKHS